MTTRIDTQPTLVHHTCAQPIFLSRRGDCYRCVRCGSSWGTLAIANTSSLASLGLRVERRPVPSILARDPLETHRVGRIPQVPEGTERLAGPPAWLLDYRPL